MPKNRKGLLIVIEGSDGAGKATQTEILIKRLNGLGYKTDTISFPIYTSIYGKKIAAFLRGEFGSVDEVSPYFVAKLFADDRKQNRKRIIDSLNQGKIVILDRYVSSNLYQASKFKDKEDKEKFISWLYDLEYNKNKLPREDVAFYLHLPNSVSQKLILMKKKRAYLNDTDSDIHEKDLSLQRSVQKTYEEAIKRNDYWKKIVCTKDSQLLSKEEINDKIFKAIIPLLKDIKR